MKATQIVLGTIIIFVGLVIVAILLTYSFKGVPKDLDITRNFFRLNSPDSFDKYLDTYFDKKYKFDFTQRVIGDNEVQFISKKDDLKFTLIGEVDMIDTLNEEDGMYITTTVSTSSYANEVFSFNVFFIGKFKPGLASEMKSSDNLTENEINEQYGNTEIRPDPFLAMLIEDRNENVTSANHIVKPRLIKKGKYAAVGEVTQHNLSNDVTFIRYEVIMSGKDFQVENYFYMAFDTGKEPQDMQVHDDMLQILSDNIVFLVEEEEN